MKIQEGKIVITLVVVFLAVLVTADSARARMGGGGHGGSTASGMSGDSRRGDDDSRRDRDRFRDRDEMHRLQGPSVRAYESISTGSLVDGGVVMELEPGRFADGRFQVRFTASTQSGDLADYDLYNLCTFEYGGKALHPEGPIHMKGRHTEGTMVFDLDEMPEHFSIIIRQIPGENQRVYKW